MYTNADAQTKRPTERRCGAAGRPPAQTQSPSCPGPLLPLTQCTQCWGGGQLTGCVTHLGLPPPVVTSSLCFPPTPELRRTGLKDAAAQLKGFDPQMITDNFDILTNDTQTDQSVCCAQSNRTLCLFSFWIILLLFSNCSERFLVRL